MDKDNRYWFPAKRYGWGWGPPLKWQGWVVLVGWCALLLGGVWVIGVRSHPVAHVIFVVAMITALVGICYVTGEPPRWRWGDDK
jgi:drug/metabolite transporter (DMT)-like permease